MTINATGIIRNGRFVHDQLLDFPENARVTAQIQMVEEERPSSSDCFDADPLTQVIGCCEGPEDLAKNIDHQLYGFAKKGK